MARSGVRWLALAPLAAALACARGSSPETAGTPNRDVITQREIESSLATNAYDAIVKLRANFLAVRGKTSLIAGGQPLPVVYVDGQSYGALTMLRQIPAAQVAQIRLNRTWDPTRYGNSRVGPVIEVTTRP